MEPEINKKQDDNAVKFEEPAVNPVDEIELPRVEQAVLSNPRRPRSKAYIIIFITAILAAVAAAYLYLQKK